MTVEKAPWPNASDPVPQPRGRMVYEAIKAGELKDVSLALVYALTRIDALESEVAGLRAEVSHWEKIWAATELDRAYYAALASQTKE